MLAAVLTVAAKFADKVELTPAKFIALIDDVDAPPEIVPRLNELLLPVMLA